MERYKGLFEYLDCYLDIDLYVDNKRIHAKRGTLQGMANNLITLI